MSRFSRPGSTVGRQGSPSGAIKLPPRAHTSQGFARKGDVPPGLEPRGFDVRSYFRQRGSAGEVRVGVNGRPSSDRALQDYVEGCKRETVGGDEYDGLSGDENSTTELDRDQASRQRLQRLFPKQVPLCWKNLLKETEENVKLSYHKPRRPKTVIIRPSKPAQLPAKQIVESLTQTLRTAPHMVSVGEESVTEWSSSSLRLDMPSVVKMADGLQPPLGVSLRSPLVAEPSLEPQACHAQLTSELLPALLLCCEAELGQHWPEVDKLLCIWFKTQSSGEFERDAQRLRFAVHLTYQNKLAKRTFSELQLERVSPSVCVVAVDGVSRAEAIAADISLTCSGHTVFTHLSSTFLTGSSAVPEKFFHRRENLCNQEEDEDLTDIKDIAQKFPDLQVLDLDSEQIEEEEEEEDEEEEEEENVSQLAVFIMPRGTPGKSAGRKPLYRPPPSASSGSSSFSSIVKQHLGQYLH